MWPDKSINYIKLKGDKSALHFGIKEDHKIQSVVSLFIESDNAQLRKLATIPAYRNKSFATKLIQHCIKISKENNCEILWLNARVDKSNFYERIGFKATNKTFEKSGLHYVIMELILH